jgi:hypothetical protein
MGYILIFVGGVVMGLGFARSDSLLGFFGFMGAASGIIVAGMGV